MSVSAYDVYQEAEDLKKRGRFIEAGVEFHRAFELYESDGKHDYAIDCIIQRYVCLIEPLLKGTTILTASEARKRLQYSLDDMEKEISNFSVKEFADNKSILYNGLKKAYLQMERLCNEYGFIAGASKCLSQAMRYRRKLASSWREWLSLWIFQPFTRYDKKEWLLFAGLFIACIILMSLFFGVLYCNFEFIKFSEKNASPPSFWDSFYFSVVTFATLGYGDIKPSCIQGRMLAISEVILGYVILGLFISILARKITQR